MMGKSCVDVLRDVTGDKSIETVADGLEKALSGGGGGGGGVFVVNFEEVEQGKLSADKTFEEIDAAMLGGQIVIGILHVSPGGMRLIDAYSFVICATGSYNVTFNVTKYAARSGDDYWAASQS